MKFFKLSLPKRIFWIGLILVTLIVASAVGYLLYLRWDGKTITKVNGQKITLKMVKETESEFSGFFKRNKTPNTLTEAEKILIEEKVVEAESLKRGITVTKEEISKKLTEDAKQYPSTEKYLAFVKSEYGWDQPQVENRIKIDLLRAKLLPLILNSKDVSGFYFRWDIYGNNLEGVNKAETEIKKFRAEAIQGKQLSEIAKKYENDPYWKTPASGSFDFKDLNSKSEREMFEGRQDWEAISKLQKTGEATEIVRSDGGYFAFYQLTKSNIGGYDSWEDFIAKNQQEKAINNFIKKITFSQIAYAICENSALVKHPTLNCCNMANYNAANHYATLYGYVYDNVAKSKLSSATVTLTKTQNYSDLCSGAITAMGGSTFSDTTDTNGYYSIPSINCWLHYSIAVSKSGYRTGVTADFKPANGTSTRKDFYLFPEYTLTVNVSPADAATPTSTVLSGANNDGGCEGAGRGCYATIQAGFVSPSANYQFSNWSGSCSGTTPTFNVYLNGNKSCTANFTYSPPPPPPPPPAQPTSLSCTAVPVGGDVPLRVQVTTTTNFAPSGSYNYNMGDGKATSTFSRTAAATDSFQYIYTTPGNFSITVSNPTSGLSATCPTGGINPTNPNDPNGGEVSP